MVFWIIIELVLLVASTIVSRFVGYSSEGVFSGYFPIADCRRRPRDPRYFRNGPTEGSETSYGTGTLKHTD